MRTDIKRIFTNELKPTTGDAAAQYNRGLDYFNGEGAQQDYAKAYLWFNIALAANIEAAKEENVVAFQKSIENYMDQAALRMSAEDLIRAKEEAMKWFIAHPNRSWMKLNDDVNGFAALTSGLRTMVRSVGAILAIGLVASVGYAAYKSLDEAGWLTHNRDTPVWIAGNWMVGEYRDCGMLTTTPPDGIVQTEQARAQLPRLFCGKNWDSEGVLEFQSAMPDYTVAADAVWGRGNWDVLNSYFHVLPVRYNGRIERPDSVFTSWRCQRQGNSLLSSDGIICNALN